MVKKFEVFDIVNYTLVTLVSIVMLYPFVNVAAVSVSSYTAFIENPMMIWPKGFNLGAYKEILSQRLLWTSYLNTVVITVSGVVLGIFLYILTAYPLTKKQVKVRGFILGMVVFTMMFNGGLIPNYYLIKSLGLLDTLAALVLPGAFTGFNLILMKNFMETIPDSLEEAAKIDGASDAYVLFKIIVPLSTPIIATLCLFQAVSYWNSFFSAVIYIRDTDKWPLMLFLREIVMGSKMQEMAGGLNQAEQMQQVPTETLKYATLMVVMIPILCVYPFLQKYFVKGIMLGSVKG